MPYPISDAEKNRRAAAYREAKREQLEKSISERPKADEIAKLVQEHPYMFVLVVFPFDKDDPWAELEIHGNHTSLRSMLRRADRQLKNKQKS